MRKNPQQQILLETVRKWVATESWEALNAARSSVEKDASLLEQRLRKLSDSRDLLCRVLGDVPVEIRDELEAKLEPDRLAGGVLLRIASVAPWLANRIKGSIDIGTTRWPDVLSNFQLSALQPMRRTARGRGITLLPCEPVETLDQHIKPIKGSELKSRLDDLEKIDANVATGLRQAYFEAEAAFRECERRAQNADREFLRMRQGLVADFILMDGLIQELCPELLGDVPNLPSDDTLTTVSVQKSLRKNLKRLLGLLLSKESGMLPPKVKRLKRSELTAAALTVLHENPELTNIQIADKIGCAPETLSRNRQFLKARAMLREEALKSHRR